MPRPTFLVVDPAHFEVSYAINPWMKPEVWGADRNGFRLDARAAFTDLTGALRTAGAEVEVLAGVPGAPDLVFPANAGVVLDGRAVVARFRHPERQPEEAVVLNAFQALKDRGVFTDVATLPDGCLQEGAGDFIWDAGRALFWTGHGPRSNLAGMNAVADFFGRPIVALELATERFYHLDTCFCPLPGGEVLYYPPAFTAAGRAAIKANVAPDLLLEASEEDAGRFCVNAVAFGRTIVMAQAADALRARLTERGYRLIEVNLSPFMLSGGGAYCMTLRLDRASAPVHSPADLSSAPHSPAVLEPAE